MFVDRTVVVGPFQCNCRIISCPKTGEAVLIDPGDEPRRILMALEAVGSPLKVKYLFHTHGHLDHIGATRPIKEALLGEATPAAKLCLHRGDEEMYYKLRHQGSLFGLSHYEDPLPIDHYFDDGEQLQVGELRFSVLYTPGHSPGSVCLRLHEDKALGVPETLFSGDTLFQGSVGRTDLWGADQNIMLRSLERRILVLDDETRVCPGHGPDTKIGVERRENPYLI